jgi:hypothetical protein
MPQPRKSKNVAAGSPSEPFSAGSDFMAYPAALRDLSRRFGATADEMAAWVFYGPDQGGLAAYVNANELDPPPRFSYTMFMHGDDDWDYLSPLMRTWFKRADIASFNPTERYLTGEALIQRWGAQPGLAPAAFIQAKIHESRLSDLHPIVGVTRGHTDDPIFPPMEKGLFELSLVRAIEAEDFGEVLVEAPAHQDDRTPDGAVARAVEDERPLARSERLLQRKRQLQAAGRRDFLKVIAAEEGGLSTKRVGDLIRRAEALGPFAGLGKELPRRTSSLKRNPKS